MISEANGWSPSAKAFHLTSSLRGNATDLLETLSEAQRHNFHSLSSVLELWLKQKCIKEYGSLQLKFLY